MSKKVKSAKAPKTVTKKHAQRNLSLPQARILSMLKPKVPSAKNPILTRVKIIELCGFSPLSGTFSRAVNGVAKMSKVAEFIGPQKGLVALKFINEVENQVDGKTEHGYEATRAGLLELQAFLKTCKDGELPGNRDRKLCLNNRYIKGADKRDRTNRKKRLAKKVKKVKVKKLAKQKAKVQKVKKGPVEVVVNAPMAA